MRVEARPGAAAAPDSTPHGRCLVLDDVTIAYGRRVILAHVSADIPRGEVVNLVGPNGSGKSTLLKAIAGLLPLAAGEIRLFDEPIGRMRRRIAYVPQREDVDWGFPVSVRDVVAMGRYPSRGWLRALTKEDHGLIAAALEELAITDLAGKQIGELSGGQQRRAFVARAVAQQADVILLDEPMSGVDQQTHDRIIELFDEWRSEGKLILQATHTHVHGGSVIELRRRGEERGPAHAGHLGTEEEEHHGRH